ncbi:MAG: MmgE/PrpD family protein [Deltaproteobacteria bacterium]|nr:MmgE/PrpD family protein [Deltaproteobacteria bacterium]
MTLSHELAEYIAATGYEDIPAEVIAKGKDCILDSLGNALYGLSFEASRIAMDVLCGETPSGKGAAVLGTAYRAPAWTAAFVNGVTAHVADYDDTLVSLNGHPSCVMMPASLAANETSGGDGRSFLTAYVVGCEIAGKLGLAMGAGHHRQGWHPTATLGAIGAAASASRALNLPCEKVVNALGIATSCASGLRINFGSMTKSLHAGNAAMKGVLAAQLAEKGFTASPSALEGEAGFAGVFGASGDLSSVPGTLGKNYVLNHIMLKPYPSCAGTHPAVDAVLKMLGEGGLDFKDIDRIEVVGRPVLGSVLIHRNPRTPLEAKFSMEYCVACAMVSGCLGIAQFHEDVLFDLEVRDLMDRVHLVLDEDMERVAAGRGILSPARVRVRSHGGDEFTETVLEARGGPSNPMSRLEIHAKFRECAGRLLPESRVKEVLKIVDNLEDLDRLDALTSILFVS